MKKETRIKILRTFMKGNSVVRTAAIYRHRDNQSSVKIEEINAVESVLRGAIRRKKSNGNHPL